MALKQGIIRRPTQFISTISDDRGEELRYCGIPISKIFEEHWGLGGVIGLLWFKKKLPKWATDFLEMVVLLTADHGPAVSGAHNAIVAALCVARDITERVKTEKALRASEERFRGITERSFDAIYELDLEGNITYISPAIERITGYKSKEVLQQIEALNKEK